MITKIHTFFRCVLLTFKIQTKHRNLLPWSWTEEAHAILDDQKRVLKALIMVNRWDIDGGKQVELVDLFEEMTREKGRYEHSLEIDFKEQQRLKEEIKQLESELILLKDLIQEKNIVIRKLMEGKSEPDQV